MNVTAVSLWNRQPYHVVNSHLLEVFILRLDNHLFTMFSEVGLDDF